MFEVQSWKEILKRFVLIGSNHRSCVCSRFGAAAWGGVSGLLRPRLWPAPPGSRTCLTGSHDSQAPGSLFVRNPTPTGSAYLCTTCTIYLCITCTEYLYISFKHSNGSIEKKFGLFLCQIQREILKYIYSIRAEQNEIIATEPGDVVHSGGRARDSDLKWPDVFTASFSFLI